MRIDAYVFLGPTLPAAEAIAICDAIVMPPVACGDVYRLVRDARPARIAIIDGYFERMAAVWHKELLFALERGVEVWGASSMGALRAAELRAFGMRGVGSICRAFARGRLTDDDEVAVVHGPAELGYPAMSTAMVDLRAGLARATISSRSKARLLDRAKARFYRDRSWDALVDDARALRLPRRERDVIAALAARAPSAKADDARALLRTIAKSRAARGRPRWKLEPTWFWHQLRAIVDSES
ncbi:MAG TPA: TfuA-like protein [Kofleriaceae bacterium]|nr:TfuA-like protein [Kofleriaceae bacterium]